MIIELKPEFQQILERAAKSGLSPEEGLNQAFALLEAQLDTEDWMLEHRQAIEDQIEEGCAQAERGELYSPEEVKRMLQEMKARRHVA